MIGNNLVQKEGIWFTQQASEISYPKDGNEMCYQLEDQSFWFRHRNQCIKKAVNNYLPNGKFLDVGGGNGYVSAMLQAMSQDVCLLEPGLQGCLNARKRGIEQVICSSLQDVSFGDTNIGAIGAFDVVEHIEDDLSFLKICHHVLSPKGKLFLTVPAFDWLWSNEDVLAGHYRRYTIQNLEEVVKGAGFKILYSTYFFSSLVIPIFLMRSIPSKLGFRKNETETAVVSKEHGVNQSLQVRVLNKLLSSERDKIFKNEKISFGSSCLLVAQKY